MQIYQHFSCPFLDILRVFEDKKQGIDALTDGF
jgi:hypothetical protein